MLDSSIETHTISKEELSNYLDLVAAEGAGASWRLANKLNQHLSRDERIELLMSHLKSTEPKAAEWEIAKVLTLSLAPIAFVLMLLFSEA